MSGQFLFRPFVLALQFPCRLAYAICSLRIVPCQSSYTQPTQTVLHLILNACYGNPQKILAAAVSILFGALVLSTWYQLFRNYLVARKIGWRFKVIPISHLYHFWMLVDRTALRYVRRYFGESTFTRYNWMYWEFPDHWKSHYEMGDVFMLVTPGCNWMYIGDPAIIMELVRRKDDFPRCVELTHVLDVFGPNLGSVSAFPVHEMSVLLLIRVASFIAGRG